MAKLPTLQRPVTVTISEGGRTSEYVTLYPVERYQHHSAVYDFKVFDAEYVRHYNTSAVELPKVRESTLTKHFDTTEIKNTALNSIVSKVEAVERALFDKAQAIAKAEADHNKHIADASLALDRVLMEGMQNGLDSDDYDNYLPEYSDDLHERASDLIELIQLANVKASV